jgi:hypothetical protein
VKVTKNQKLHYRCEKREDFIDFYEPFNSNDNSKIRKIESRAILENFIFEKDIEDVLC